MKTFLCTIFLLLLCQITHAAQTFTLKAPAPSGPGHYEKWVLDTVKPSADGKELLVFWRLGDVYSPSNKILMQSLDRKQFKETGKLEFDASNRYTTYFSTTNQDFVATGYDIYNLTTKKIQCNYNNNPYTQPEIKPSTDGNHFFANYGSGQKLIFYKTNDCSSYFSTPNTNHLNGISYDPEMQRIALQMEILDITGRPYAYETHAHDISKGFGKNTFEVKGFDVLTSNVYTNNTNYDFRFNPYLIEDYGDLYINSYPDLKTQKALVKDVYDYYTPGPYGFPPHFLFKTDMADPKYGIYLVYTPLSRPANVPCYSDLYLLDLSGGSSIRKVSLPNHCQFKFQTQYLDDTLGRGHKSDFGYFPGNGADWILDSPNKLVFTQDGILDLKTDTFLNNFPQCWSLKINQNFNSGLCLEFSPSTVQNNPKDIKSATVSFFDFKNRTIVSSIAIPQDQIDFKLVPEQQFFLEDGVGVIAWETAVTIIIFK